MNQIEQLTSKNANHYLKEVDQPKAGQRVYLEPNFLVRAIGALIRPFVYEALRPEYERKAQSELPYEERRQQEIFKARYEDMAA